MSFNPRNSPFPLVRFFGEWMDFLGEGDPEEVHKVDDSISRRFTKDSSTVPLSLLKTVCTVS